MILLLPVFNLWVDTGQPFCGFYCWWSAVICKMIVRMHPLGNTCVYYQQNHTNCLVWVCLSIELVLIVSVAGSIDSTESVRELAWILWDSAYHEAFITTCLSLLHAIPQCHAMFRQCTTGYVSMATSDNDVVKCHFVCMPSSSSVSCARHCTRSRCLSYVQSRHCVPI